MNTKYICRVALLTLIVSYLFSSFTYGKQTFKTFREIEIGSGIFFRPATYTYTEEEKLRKSRDNSYNKSYNIYYLAAFSYNWATLNKDNHIISYKGIHPLSLGGKWKYYKTPLQNNQYAPFLSIQTILFIFPRLSIGIEKMNTSSYHGFNLEYGIRGISYTGNQKETRLFLDATFNVYLGKRF